MKRHYHYWCLTVLLGGGQQAVMNLRPYAHGQSADQGARRSGLNRESYFIRMCFLPDCHENYCRSEKGLGDSGYAEV